MSAVSDTCFIVNWSNFRRRGDLFKHFKTINLPIAVIDEVRDVDVKRFIAGWIVKGFIKILPSLPSIDVETLKLIRLVENIPSLPRIDPPEAYGLIYAKILGIPLLTDNKAPKRIVKVIKEYEDVAVLDSLDVLKAIYCRRGLLRSRVKEFMQDTGISFSAERLREIDIDA
jgi:hypothetical protein